LGERDANHAAVAQAYEKLYCQVLDLSAVGRGCPDMLVRIPTRKGSVLQLVEVKTAKGALSDSQLRFSRDFGAFEVVRTWDDVFNHVERVRAA